MINFHYPDWIAIERGSIIDIDKVRDILFSKSPDATGGHAEPLRFSAPKVHPMADRGEVRKRSRPNEQSSDFDGKLELEKIDL